MAMDSLVRPARLLASLFLLGSMCCRQQNITLENKIDLFPGTKDTMMFRQFYNGLEHGRWVKYYPSGKIMEVRYFNKGVKVDTLRIWWENGKLQAQIPFQNGEYEGESIEWNPEGRMIRRLHYHKGYEEGAQQQWYDDGSVRSNYVIRNGRRYGLLGTKNCVNVLEKASN